MNVLKETPVFNHFSFDSKIDLGSSLVDGPWE